MALRTALRRSVVPAVALLFTGLTPTSSAAQSGFSRLSTSHRVIVQSSPERVRDIARRYGAQIRRQLSVGGVLELTSRQLDALSRDPNGALISADTLVEASMATSASAIGADQVWGGLGHLTSVTGRGIGIAILDSGIAPHPDLADRVLVNLDFVDPEGDGTDRYGHGTHAAGIAAGRPTSGSVAGYPGVAPGAHLLNLRVLDKEGRGHASSVMAAIDWTIANRERYAIRVLNISLGGAVSQTYQHDPLALAVERAVAHGLVVVCSAGNHGKTGDGTKVFGGITTPGNTPAALTVGAVNTFGSVVRSDDGVASYSSRGPTAFDYVIKPDVAAPGNRVVSLQAPGSYLPVSYPELQVPGGYLELSGTSMSAAMVSGAVALLLETNPALTPRQVKAALQLTASPVANAGLIAAGAGSINVVSALHAAVAGPSIDLPSVQIGGETQTAGNLVFTAKPASEVKARWGTLRGPYDLEAAVRSNNVIRRLAPNPSRGGVSRNPRAGLTRPVGRLGRTRTPAGEASGKQVRRGKHNRRTGTLVRGDASNQAFYGGTIVWGDAGGQALYAGTFVWGDADDQALFGRTILWRRCG